MKTISTDNYWADSFSLVGLENIRVEIRDLIRLLEKEKRRNIYSNFEYEITTSTVSDALPIYTISEKYKQRVEKYIRENTNNPVIQKLKQNIPISHSEWQALEFILFDGKERDTIEDFVKSRGQQPFRKFIRSIVGMDTYVAKEAFGEFLTVESLSADQIGFVGKIIDYVTKNGVIDAEMLFE